MKLKPYDSLVEDILNLNSNYSTFLGRYLVVERASPQNSLESLIGRVNEHVSQCQCHPARKTQRDVFSQLVTELRPYINKPAKEADEIKKATLFLLGALIHRRLRIQIECQGMPMASAAAIVSTVNYVVSSFSSFFAKSPVSEDKAKKGTPENSILYNAIGSALKLGEKIKDKDEGKTDKDESIKNKEQSIQLDELTIVNALEVFRTQMYAEIDTVDNSTGKTIRYKTYPHFAADPNFKTHLDELIREHRVRGAEVIKEFKAISFLQSLVAQLSVDRAIIEKELGEWGQSLCKDHKGSLTQQSVISHLEAYFSSKVDKGPVKTVIQDLIKKGYEEFDHRYNLAVIKEVPDFLDTIKKIDKEHRRLILCGGYFLLLHTGKLDKKFLTYVVGNRGYGLELEKGDEQTAHLMLLECFQLYVKNKSFEKLDYAFFGEKSLMDSQIAQIVYKLEEQQREMQKPALQ